DCVKAEIGSQQALRLMLASDKPPGAKAIAQTCELVLQADPAMADWRECVDVALAEHATPQAADACKLSVTWHATKNGAEAGHL
ncbi:hypothetical protein ACE40V_24600, partial [Salmonella enterica]|uniref:hypothetical protein n=1 Tax=Salmonella enterica TaxID=28901 RepID=UPI003D2DE810